MSFDFVCLALIIECTKEHSTDVENITKLASNKQVKERCSGTDGGLSVSKCSGTDGGLSVSVQWY